MIQQSSEGNMRISTDDKLFYSNIQSDKNDTIKAGDENSTGELLHIRDVNSRDIFKNNTLTSQFLRDYSADKWTAGMHLSDRVRHAELAMDYIPNFTYRIVPLKEYGNQELIDRNNEMSLIMMINKIQGADGFHDFRKTALDYLKSIYGQTSANIQDVILEVIWGLLMKIDVPKEEAADMLKNVREGKDMGVLFENFQKFDWREAQKNLEEAEKKLEKAEKKQKESDARADKAESELRKAQALLAKLQRDAPSQQ